MKIRWSKYVNFYNSNDDVILFHSVNRAVNKIMTKDLEKINAYLRDGITDVDTKNIISELYVDKFIVLKEEKEEEEFRKVREGRDASGECLVYFIPTFSCNFRCPYCIVESTEHEAECHSEIASADDVVTMAVWLKEYVLERGLKKLTIELFGGEPMVGHEQNLIFLKELSTLKEEGIELTIHMISNCYLLTEKKIEELAQYGLKSIQCTIDGPKEIHDKRRILANGEGSFDQIIENISILKEKEVELIIRINIDQENAPYICELLDFLEEKGFQKSAVLGIAPVDPPITNEAISGHTAHTMKYLESIYKKLKEKKFNFRLWETFCGHGTRDFFVLCPDGKLYNCPSFAGLNGYEVGDVNAGGFYKERPGMHDIPDKCYSCSLVGVCAGGCFFTKTVHQLGEQYCLKLTHSAMAKNYFLARYGS